MLQKDADLLEGLRTRLNDEARDLLDTVWHYYLERDKWISSIRLQHKFGKDKLQVALKSLNGSIVLEKRGMENHYYYLTFLGMLLTEQGPELEELLNSYLRLVKKKLYAGFETNDLIFESPEIEAALKLNDEKSQLFHTFLSLSPFRNGGGSSGNYWSTGVPSHMIDLLLADDLGDYIHQYAFKNYDPNIPSTDDERTKYLNNRQKRKGSVANPSETPASITEEINNLLLELPNQIPDTAERTFLNETIICFTHGAYRAAIIMCWNLAYDHLCEYILKNHLAKFNAQLPKSYPKANVSSVAKKDDFSELKDSQVLQVCRSANIISRDINKILQEKLARRNMAAHPSSVAIASHTAGEFIIDLIPNVVLKLV